MPHQRPRDSHPLLLPAGEVFDRLIHLVRQSHPFQQRVRFRSTFLSEQAQRRREESHIRQAGIEYILPAVGIFHQRKILIDRADGGLDGTADPASGRFKMDAVDHDRSAVAAVRAVKDAEQGGFSRAGRPDDRHKFSLSNRKAHVGQGAGMILKRLTDALDFQQHRKPFSPAALSELRGKLF